MTQTKPPAIDLGQVLAAIPDPLGAQLRAGLSFLAADSTGRVTIECSSIRIQAGPFDVYLQSLSVTGRPAPAPARAKGAGKARGRAPGK